MLAAGPRVSRDSVVQLFRATLPTVVGRISVTVKEVATLSHRFILYQRAYAYTHCGSFRIVAYSLFRFLRLGRGPHPVTITAGGKFLMPILPGFRSQRADTRGGYLRRSRTRHLFPRLPPTVSHKIAPFLTLTSLVLLSLSFSYCESCTNNVNFKSHVRSLSYCPRTTSSS